MNNRETEKHINEQLRKFNDKCNLLKVSSNDRALLLAAIQIGLNRLLTSSYIYDLQYGDDFDLFIDWVISFTTEGLSKENVKVISDQYSKLRVYDNLYNKNNMKELFNIFDGLLDD